MKNFKFLVLPFSILLFSAFTIYNSTNWQIQDGYQVHFSGTDAEGIFKNVSGDIQFDGTDLTSSNCSFQIDVNSINTGNGTQNKHAISDVWFDAENYPFIEFESSSFAKTESGYSVTGKMNIHGIEKEITIPFTFTNNVFEADFSVMRLDYNVGVENDVSNEIKLVVSIPVTKE